MMSYEDFQIALREFKAQNPVQIELAKQAVACVRGETKDECSHPYSINSDGWKICVTCGKYLSGARVFYRNDDYKSRVLFRDTGPDRVKLIRDTLNELVSMIVRRSIAREVLCPDGRYCIESVYVEPPEAGVSRGLFSHLKELCDICKKYISRDNTPVEEGRRRRQPFSIRCRTRSLCAAVADC